MKSPAQLEIKIPFPIYRKDQTDTFKHKVDIKEKRSSPVYTQCVRVLVGGIYILAIFLNFSVSFRYSRADRECSDPMGTPGHAPF